VSGDAQHLVRCLLQVDVTKRFGNMVRGARDVRGHRWFHGVDWDALLRKQLNAPFVPDVKSAGDAAHFQAYPDMVLRRADQPLYEKEFKDF
jgi:protein kinase A